MARGLRLRVISRLIPNYFQSCRSKHKSNLPKDPIPKSSLLQSNPNDHHPRRRRRPSFKYNIPATFFSTASKPNHSLQHSSSSSSSSKLLGSNDDSTAPRRKIYVSGCCSDDQDMFQHSISPPPPPEKKKQRIRRQRTARLHRRSFRMSTSSVERGLFFRTEFGFEEEEEEGLAISNDNCSDSQSQKQAGWEVDGDTAAAARLSVFLKRRRAVAVGKVRESFAVMKRSERPYEDFQRSMMEMILDKDMFDKIELEQLLACFLSLNSPKYHGVIVQAFADIWVSLFNHN